MRVYKLLTEDNDSYGGTHWEPGVWRRKPLKKKLYKPDGVFYGFTSLLTVLLVRYLSVPDGQDQLWEAEAEDVVEVSAGKALCFSLRVVKPLPRVYLLTKEVLPLLKSDRLKADLPKVRIPWRNSREYNWRLYERLKDQDTTGLVRFTKQ
jgi:hypothetical protein